MEHYAFSSDEASEGAGGEYALHNAAEAGDVELLTLLLCNPGQAEAPAAEGAIPDVSFFMPTPSAHHDLPDLNKRDDDNCTPLHVAILHGQLEAMRLLLNAGARATAKCEGSPALQMAVCVGSHPTHAAFALQATELLLQHGAVAYDRDDQGRTPLHWAAVYGLHAVAEALAAAACEFAALQPPPTSAEEGPLPTLQELSDKQGNTPLHLAARNRQPKVLAVLLSLGDGPPAPTAIKHKNKSGLNVLHLAALSGDEACIAALLEASPAAASTTSRQGLIAAGIAAKRGHVKAAALLQGAVAPSPTSPRHHHQPHASSTLVLAPPDCFDHHTAPWPFMRGMSDPPPENVNRLVVLTKPGYGILRTCEFAGAAALRWDERARHAPLGDVLRVHDWAYVRKVQAACNQLSPSTSSVGHLDGDTAISRGTFGAALAAAGAVCHAVDEVIAGRARNAFCAVRPPGHHAGPSGVVTSANDPNGSHGFCILNNVAIGAAYAMTVHRHAGIKRVALLDFDVHHGNGTEACVANTAASLAKFAFSTAYGEGMQQFPVYKPWYDSHDKENIFFASVQGYGPKMPGMNAFVYPGSGATCDTRASAADVAELEETDADEAAATAAALAAAEAQADAAAVAAAAAAAARASSGPHELIEEDPDQEFVYGGGEMPRVEGPRIIDVGIPGGGPRVALWRRAWRDKILPALVKFDPDLILVSAGFDAHKKDEINFAYIGVQEKDFEWLTDQLVQVANRCCAGRMVSVLEGGYRIQGAVVSAFARSVAAHVRAMSEPNGQVWDPKDAKWEREHEKQVRAEAEAKRAAAAAAAAAAYQAAAAAAAAAATAGEGAAAAEGEGQAEGGLLESGGMVEGGTAAAAAVDEAVTKMEIEGGAGGGEEAPVLGKRRRGAVDYVALNQKLEAEAAAAPPN